MEVEAQSQVPGQPPQPQDPAAAASPPEVAPKPEVGSERFAYLARKEKEITDRAKAFKAEQDKFKAEMEQFNSTKSKFTKENILKDPDSFFKETGVTIEEFLQAKLDRGEGKEFKPDPLDEVGKLAKEIEELKKERENERLQLQKAQEEKQMAHFKANLTEQIKSKADEFELINLYESYGDVMDVMEAFFNENGRMIAVTADGKPDIAKSIEIAAKQVEDYLSEFVGKGQGAKKFAQAVTEPTNPKPAITEVVTERPVPKTPSPTITNKAVAAPPNPSPSGLISKEESLKRAASLLKFK